MRHEIMEHIFENPTILEEMDFLFKDDTARRMLVFYQPEENSKGSDDVVDTRSRFGLNESLQEPSQGTVLQIACYSTHVFPINYISLNFRKAHSLYN